MPELPPIGHGQVDSARRAHLQGKASAAERTYQPTQAERRSDRVELSQHARLLGKLRHSSAVREELVDRVRNEIDTDSYETPDKLDAALDRLIDDAIS